MKNVLPPISVLLLHASEDSPVALNVMRLMGRPGLVVSSWNEEDLGGWLLRGLLDMISKYQFVIVILEADDFVDTPEGGRFAPRDNVVLELGASFALKGIQGTFVVMPSKQSLKLPTDIQGLVVKKYTKDTALSGAMRYICDQIAASMFAVVKKGLTMNQDTFLRAVSNLGEEIWNRPDYRNRIPDVILGLNHGGAIVAGMLVYRDRRAPFFALNGRSYDDMIAQLKYLHPLLLKRTTQPVALLVDDTLRTGKYMSKTIQLVKKHMPEVKLKIAAVLYRPDLATSYSPRELEPDLITPDPNLFPRVFGKIFYEGK
ncbi:MAG: hypothetical protein GY792_21965 [Gammaproteobacteria bacterium]|nr:hypothetical protein [Gammaproteobacteria bacterium]